MSMNNALNGSQPYTSTFKRVRRVKTLEYAEQLVYVFHIESDSIVPNEDHHLVFLIFASDFDLGRRACAREFNRVRNQVDQRQPQHGAVSIPGRQRAHSPNDI